MDRYSNIVDYIRNSFVQFWNNTMKKIKHKVKLFRDKQNRKNHAKKAKRNAIAKAKTASMR